MKSSIAFNAFDIDTKTQSGIVFVRNCAVKLGNVAPIMLCYENYLIFLALNVCTRGFAYELPMTFDCFL